MFRAIGKFIKWFLIISVIGISLLVGAGYWMQNDEGYQEKLANNLIKRIERCHTEVGEIGCDEKGKYNEAGQALADAKYFEKRRAKKIADALAKEIAAAKAYDSVPKNRNNFARTDAEVGCGSTYSKDRTKDIFNAKYKGHRMTWTGEVLIAEADMVAIRMDSFGTQDLQVDFSNKNAGYYLREGQEITVTFIMKSAGGCFLPFSGKEGEII